VGRAIVSSPSRPIAGLPATSRVVFVGKCLARSAVRAFLNGIIAADAQVWS